MYARSTLELEFEFTYPWIGFGCLEPLEGELEVHEFYSTNDVRDAVTFCVAISSFRLLAKKKRRTLRRHSDGSEDQRMGLQY